VDIAGWFHGLGRQQYERPFATAEAGHDFAATFAFWAGSAQAIDIPPATLGRSKEVIG